MMLERYVHRAITEGIAYLQANPDELLDFFQKEALLENDEAVQIKDWFLANTPDVIHGYARKDAKFPLYAITLTSERQAQGFIGDEGAFHDDPEDPEFGADDWTAIWEYTLNIIVYAQHPDVTLYLFHLLKHFLIAAEPLFKNDGDYFDIGYSGTDMVPDPSTTPAGLFMRRLQFVAKRQYTQSVIGSKLGRAWKVQGIHVDRSGAEGRDVGGVKTNVQVVVDDEGDDD